MTATDELRRMLDERGVEWWQKKRHTCWKVGKGQEVEMWRAWEAPDGSLTLKVDYIYDLTPEQAIAVTLGRGECRNVAEPDEYSDRPFTCSECGARGADGQRHVSHCEQLGHGGRHTRLRRLMARLEVLSKLRKEGGGR